MRTLALALGLLLVSDTIQPARTGIVAYYAGLSKSSAAHSTSCADSYGRVTVFEGAVRGRRVAHPEVYSICVESTESVEKMLAVFDKAGVEAGFGATLTN